GRVSQRLSVTHHDHRRLRGSHHATERVDLRAVDGSGSRRTQLEICDLALQGPAALPELDLAELKIAKGFGGLLPEFAAKLMDVDVDLGSPCPVLGTGSGNRLLPAFDLREFALRLLQLGLRADPLFEQGLLAGNRL